MKILIITHQLTRTGAALAAYDLANALRKECSVDIVALKDGPLKEEYSKLGMNLTILPNLINDIQGCEVLLRKYDCVVANTLQCTPIVEYMGNNGEKVFWWIHENVMHFEQIKEYLATMEIPSNVDILSAGMYVEELVTKYLNKTSQILNIKIQDRPREVVENHDCFRIAQVGLFDGMKGQETLIAAMTRFSEDMLRGTEIYFVGDVAHGNPEILGVIEKAQNIFGNVYVMDSLSRDEMSQFYDMVDCVVVASRMESMSAVALESFMKRKLCVCTDTAGASRYITDGHNGYVFPMGDTDRLATILKEIYVMPQNQYDQKVNRAREIYDKYFDEAIFEANIRQIFGLNQD